MKVKKWMALALAAVMAVGVMTGCSGGSSASTVNSKSAMTVSKVNNALRKADSDAKAKTVNGLEDAVKKGAEYVAGMGVLDSNTLQGYIASARGWGKDSTTYGAAFVVSEEELEAGFNVSTAASAIATQVKLTPDVSKAEEIGTLDTTEKVAAAVILGVDDGLQQLVDNPFVNISDITYAVSGRKVTLPNDAVYYLIVVEMSTGK